MNPFFNKVSAAYYVFSRNGVLARTLLSVTLLHLGIASELALHSTSVTFLIRLKNGVIFQAAGCNIFQEMALNKKKRNLKWCKGIPLGPSFSAVDAGLLPSAFCRWCTPRGKAIAWRVS